MIQHQLGPKSDCPACIDQQDTITVSFPRADAERLLVRLDALDRISRGDFARDIRDHADRVRVALETSLREREVTS